MLLAQDWWRRQYDGNIWNAEEAIKMMAPEEEQEVIFDDVYEIQEIIGK